MSTSSPTTKSWGDWLPIDAFNRSARRDGATDLNSFANGCSSSATRSAKTRNVAMSRHGNARWTGRDRRTVPRFCMALRYVPVACGSRRNNAGSHGSKMPEGAPSTLATKFTRASGRDLHSSPKALVQRWSSRPRSLRAAPVSVSEKWSTTMSGCARASAAMTSTHMRSPATVCGCRLRCTRKSGKQCFALKPPFLIRSNAAQAQRVAGSGSAQ